MEPLFEVEQRGGEFDFVAIQQGDTIMEVERIRLETGGRGQRFERKGYFVGFIEADSKFVAGGSEGGV